MLASGKSGTTRQLKRKRTKVTVAVDRECIGIGGYASKSAALRYAVKQPCEVGTVPHTGNLVQPADGQLTKATTILTERRMPNSSQV